MSPNSRRRFLMTLMLPLTLQACHSQTDSEKSARQFIETYYVHFNPREAKELSGGLAEEKISHQIALLEGVTPEDPSQLPKVDYRLVSTPDAASPQEASYIFEVTSKAKDVGEKKVYMKLRMSDGVWKVMQFSEQP